MDDSLDLVLVIGTVGILPFVLGYDRAFPYHSEGRRDLLGTGSLEIVFRLLRPPVVHPVALVGQPQAKRQIPFLVEVGGFLETSDKGIVKDEFNRSILHDVGLIEFGSCRVHWLISFQDRPLVTW